MAVGRGAVQLNRTGSRVPAALSTRGQTFLTLSTARIAASSNKGLTQDTAATAESVLSSTDTAILARVAASSEVLGEVGPHEN